MNCQICGGKLGFADAMKQGGQVVCRDQHICRARWAERHAGPTRAPKQEQTRAIPIDQARSAAR